SGSQMGPGDGWFHSSQSRYDWKTLAARLDTNKDGKIDRSEFRGPTDWFNRLDRDRNGVLTPADFDWSPGSAHVRQDALIDLWFRLADARANGRISRAEWDAFFTRAAKAKGYLTPDD